MVGVMDDGKSSEGLFLKNYLGTVSAVPRSRTATHVDTKSSRPHGDYNNWHSPPNAMPNHGRIIYCGGDDKESTWKQQNDIDGRNAINHGGSQDPNRLDDDDKDKDKKKDKKWTLGGLFRRKSKKDGDDSSEDSADDVRKGFLSRRKSKRERRKFKARNSANGFDVVIPQHKETAAANGEISVEQLWGGKATDSGNGPVRYIHRHPETPKPSNSPQVPKHSRRDSNLSRNSGGSDHADGRRGRKEVMARAEAKRDLMRDESSSDEYESYHSNSSLNRVNGDSRRQRRADRQKRLSRDEEERVTKSDLEGGRRLPPNCRWISRTYYPDSSDHDVVRANLMTHSGTPSPCRSPRARQKQLLQYMMMQNGYPTSTFPPGVHYQHAPARSPTRNHHAKENHSLIACRNQSYRTNRNSDYNLPRSLSSSENSNRRTLADCDQFFNPCGSGKEKSLSFDQNIHRASYFENDPDLPRNNCSATPRRSVRPEPPTINPRPNVYNHGPHHAAKTYNGVPESRTDSTASLQPATFPQHPQQILPKSPPAASSFCEASAGFPSNRSNSYQHIPATHVYFPRSDVPPTSHLNGSPSILRYYADQNPRSRNPIHITCNPTSPEHPYLSDSQMVVKPAQTAVRSSASDFWKLKDQELVRQQKTSDGSLKPPQSTARSDRSRSNSPRTSEGTRTLPKSQEKPGNGFESAGRKVFKEELNAAKMTKSPPDPPVRRLSKQEVLARLQKCQQLKTTDTEIRTNAANDTEVHNSNLDDALNELEMIYNSLRLKDEDLVDRAGRRDLPVFRPKNPITSVSVRDKIHNFYAEADYPKPTDSHPANAHQRAVPLRRSGVPDKTTDDMAFRRLNQKDRTDVKQLPPQSYLRSSPALSPAPCASPALRKDSPVLEPDVTYDDVVFRNIRHANSTLKVHDPQPPFGIPIGVITPAPNSDYLHATPTERFRPTFTSSKIPDVVKDDLAFRNLRKDSRTNASLDPTKNDLKKRAVRSLSANLYNIMQKDDAGLAPVETNNNTISQKSCEKTQSLTDLTKGRQGLEKRLKELKEEKNAKRLEFFELSREGRKRESPGAGSWAELEETKGDSEGVRESKGEDAAKKLRSPVVELSKYPAAAPSSSLQGNPFKEPSLDDDQLENLLSALAKEAENASKDLARQLVELETRNAGKEAEDGERSKARAIEEFNRKFTALDKGKRRRNLSLSSATESKEEVRKTGSLERRRKVKKEFSPFEEVLRGREKEAKAEGNERKSALSESGPGMDSREWRRRSQNFEVVTDLSQILHDAEVQQRLNNEVGHRETNNVFQEVYEYNCRLPGEERRRSVGGEEPVAGAEQVACGPDAASDVESEFEKLHEEVKGNAGQESRDKKLAVVDELMADIRSVEQSGSGPYSSFPFPVALGLPQGSGRSERRDGKGEGSRQEVVRKNQQRSS